MTDDARRDEQDPNAQEPSMEDILSSIRRILSEEADAPEGGSDVPPDAAVDLAAPAASDVDGGGEPPAPEEFDGGEDVHVAALAESAPAPPQVFDLTPDMRVAPDAQGVKVLSPPVASASSDALAQLAKAILNRRDIAVGGHDVTLEGMVREMLRPLLREWLDRNLPYLIERLVRKEIDSMINRAERLED